MSPFLPTPSSRQQPHRPVAPDLRDPGPAFLRRLEPDVDPVIGTETTIATDILAPRWIAQDMKSLAQLEGIATGSSPFMNNFSICHGPTIAISLAGEERDLDIYRLASRVAGHVRPYLCPFRLGIRTGPIGRLCGWPRLRRRLLRFFCI